MTYLQAKSRIKNLFYLSIGLFVAGFLFFLLAITKMAYYKSSNECDTFPFVCRVIVGLIGWLYENAPPIRWAWSIPLYVPNQPFWHSLLNAPVFTSIFMMLCGAYLGSKRVDLKQIVGEAVRAANVASISGSYPTSSASDSSGPQAPQISLKDAQAGRGIIINQNINKNLEENPSLNPTWMYVIGGLGAIATGAIGSIIAQTVNVHLGLSR